MTKWLILVPKLRLGTQVFEALLRETVNVELTRHW